MFDYKEIDSIPGVAAIISPCSARKSKLSSPALDCSSLPYGHQAEVGAQWMARLGKGAPCALAGELYVGDSVARARTEADRAKARFFIISAGLGLLRSTTAVPSYDLTLAQGVGASIRDRITDGFDPDAWWVHVQSGPFSCPLDDISLGGSGRILVALTRPYAELVGTALATLPSGLQKRLRIFGIGISAHLPEALKPQIIPFDTRLDVISPGTRLNGAARQLVHFSDLVTALPIGSVEQDLELVDKAFACLEVPSVISRERADDAALLKRIDGLAREGLSATSALRRLREVGMACEERRFRRLYKEAAA